jgi:hypothetical protein
VAFHAAAVSFSKSYAEARSKFLAAAAAAGAAVQSHPHPLPGRDGEALAMDVARLGATNAGNVLLVTSACHGVEGYCGSGVQVALLADAALQARAAAAGVAIVLVHALNPYGFSWWRRATHENVDLNRNWHDFSQPLPANPDYDALADAIVPATWPAPEADAALQAYAQAHGLRALQAAFSGGQHTHPDGLFFGGHEPTWSQRTLRGVLREHGSGARRLAWIDVHTGLGPSGVGERILAARDDTAALARARAWWGAGVTSIYDGSSSSARLRGLMFEGAYTECPHAEYAGIALEYGTIPLEQAMHALRAEQWLHNHPEAPAAQRREIKQAMFEAFYTDTDAWREAVLAQAFEAVQQGIDGLAG